MSTIDEKVDLCMRIFEEFAPDLPEGSKVILRRHLKYHLADYAFGSMMDSEVRSEVREFFRQQTKDYPKREELESP